VDEAALGQELHDIVHVFEFFVVFVGDAYHKLVLQLDKEFHLAEITEPELLPGVVESDFADLEVIVERQQRTNFECHLFRIRVIHRLRSLVRRHSQFVVLFVRVDIMVMAMVVMMIIVVISVMIVVVVVVMGCVIS